MGRVEGKVAFITGAARGIGRSQALRLAEEGADIIVVDIDQRTESVPYELSSAADLAETARQVEELGRRVVVRTADVRDPETLKAAADDGVAELGRLDIVSANAGIVSYGTAIDMPDGMWRDMIDINLTGVWNTVRATVPHIRAGGRGGSIVVTSSVAGLRPYEDLSHYAAAKHGVMGFARSLALELAPELIRVNTVNPGGVATGMIHNAETYALFAPELQEKERTAEAIRSSFQADNALPIPWVEPIDVANAMLFLVSEEARYITGIALPIDGGGLLK